MSQNEFQTPAKPWAFRLNDTTLALIGQKYAGLALIPQQGEKIILIHRTAVCAIFSGNADMFKLMGSYIPDPDDAEGEHDHEVLPRSIVVTTTVPAHLLVVGKADRSQLPEHVLAHVGANEQVIVVDTRDLAYSVATNQQARDKTAHMLHCTCGDCNYRELWALVDFSAQPLQHAA